MGQVIEKKYGAIKVVFNNGDIVDYRVGFERTTQQIHRGSSKLSFAGLGKTIIDNDDEEYRFDAGVGLDEIVEEIEREKYGTSD